MATLNSLPGISHSPLSTEELSKIHAYWRAANYLSVGQIYLYANPLLRQALTLEHIKPRLLGHWGTTPGLNFIYAHLNRVIKRHDLDMIFVAGPGHGGPGVVANTYLEGTYSELYPEVSRDAEGLGKLFKQFSFPGGIPSHAAPETPGSIHEGGELGYSLAHAFAASFDDPDLIVAFVIGCGAPETVIAEIRAIQAQARAKGRPTRPRWPMIILRTLKGWTGPKEVDGKKTEGSWRSHQVPLADMATKPEHVRLLEQWMKSYRPEE